jgi:hypothetical protein
LVIPAIEFVRSRAGAMAAVFPRADDDFVASTLSPDGDAPAYSLTGKGYRWFISG